MMTRAQGEALATLVSRIRDDWDHPGILAAILKAQALGTPAQVSIALLRLTENRELRTPLLLASPGRHWSEGGEAEASAPKKRATMLCPDHPGREVPCDLCREGKRPPTPEELDAARDAARAAREAYHERMQQLRGELGKVR